MDSTLHHVQGLLRTRSNLLKRIKAELEQVPPSDWRDSEILEWIDSEIKEHEREDER